MSGLLLADMASRAAGKMARDYHNETTLHPLGLASVAILGIWLLMSQRKTAMLPLMLLVCSIPSAQRIVIAGADFTLLRIMVVVGIIRILMRGELSAIKFNRIDAAFFLYVVVAWFVFILKRQDANAVVYACGVLLDMVGPYLLARALIQNLGDLRFFALSVSLLAMVVSLFFVIEFATGRNIFSVFGGVPDVTAVRDGRLRCQGAFSHPILAGVFWASMGAFLFGGALGSWHRVVFCAGTVCCVVIVVTSASSTPVLGFAAGIAFWAWWPVRQYMKYAFISAPLIIAALHCVMNKPVWHLVARVSAVGGSTGYHRYILIDAAIYHFPAWWLAGTESTVHWSDYRGGHWQTFDITNQYIVEGVCGGIWRLSLFLVVIFLVGLALSRGLRRAANRSDQLLLWGLAASLFVHCVCFIGVSYFGQITCLWYATLAIGASVASPQFLPSSLNSKTRGMQRSSPVFTRVLVKTRATL
jgi:hypothetical protein